MIERRQLSEPGMRQKEEEIMAYWKMQHGQSVVLQDEELLRRRKANLDYMMELKTENLTLSYLMEAGLYKTSETQTLGDPDTDSWRMGIPALRTAGPFPGTLAFRRGHVL